MIQSSHYQHGGNVEELKREYQLDQELIDFSANVNPNGISPKAKKMIQSNLEVISSYPDTEYVQLKQSIVQYSGAAFEDILLGNGSTELISNFIHYVSPKNALIIGPTYSEYEREVKLNGGNYQYYALKESRDFCIDVEEFLTILNSSIDLIILCNPNNPTGTSLNQGVLRQILQICQKHNIFMMIDETYIEFATNSTSLSAIPLTKEFSNLFVIRGISKFFASPGLRFGYGICSHKGVKNELKEKQDPWNINSIANIAVPAMLSDIDYIENTQKMIQKQRQFIVDTLSSWASLKIYETNANFILCKIINDKISSKEIFEALLKKGLLIRDCSSFPFLDSTYIRFCFMKEEQNLLLIEQMQQILESNE